MAPFRSTAALLLLLMSPACDERLSTRATLDLHPSTHAVGGHLPQAFAVNVRTASGPRQISPAAFSAALGPDDAVAFVDLDGLHLWRDGVTTLIAKATPRGMSANAHGVVFASAAKSGHGSGLALMTWDGRVRALVAAPEDLPGPAGYLKPALSQDGRFVIAFNDLTPRPSLFRVDTVTFAKKQLAAEVPSVVGEPAWVGNQLTWFTGDSRATLDVNSAEVTVQ